MRPWERRQMKREDLEIDFLHLLCACKSPGNLCNAVHPKSFDAHQLESPDRANTAWGVRILHIVQREQELKRFHHSGQGQTHTKQIHVKYLKIPDFSERRNVQMSFCESRDIFLPYMVNTAVH